MDGIPDFAAALDALAKGKQKAEAPPYNPLRFLSAAALQGKPIPIRKWIVEDWLPAGVVSLSYGDGGVGKTLLAQQLMTSCAAGVHWCGLPVKRCKVVALFCEDDEDEIHRRQHDINAYHGISYDKLADMLYASGVGEDNVLLRFDHDGTPSVTQRYNELAKVAEDFGAELVIVDTAADTFGGNENDRQQVRQFIANTLTRLAQKIKGAVLVNAHPSRSGLSAGGSMDSGSTGWSNSARSRWALTRPEAPEGDTPDPDTRILTRRKANHASIGEEIKLKWQNGLLVPERGDIASAFAGIAKGADIEATFLKLLEAAIGQGRSVRHTKHADEYAPKVFSKAPGRRGYTKNEFEFAMERLLANGRIAIVEYGPPSRLRHKLVVGSAQEDNQA